MDFAWFATRRQERRAAGRVPGHQLRVSCWGETSARNVRDIAAGGAFVETLGHWRTGTLIHMVLQWRPDGYEGPMKIFGLWSRVVRTGPDGMAVQFLTGSAVERNRLKEFLAGVHAENGSNEANQNGQ